MIAKIIITWPLIFFGFSVYSQSEPQGELKNDFSRQLAFYQLRSDHVVDFGIGSAVMNGDLPDPLFEIYFKAGYKYHVFPHLAIGFGYHKFNVAFKDRPVRGQMSFDVNLEYTMLPCNRLSPYLFAGSGYNAFNYFEETQLKVQGGVGLEYIFSDGVGIKIFSDYNHLFSDEVDGLEFGNADDVYWRIGVGVNLYLGREAKRKKLMENVDTVIKHHPINPHEVTTKK